MLLYFKPLQRKFISQTGQAQICRTVASNQGVMIPIQVMAFMRWGHEPSGNSIAEMRLATGSKVMSLEDQLEGY